MNKLGNAHSALIVIVVIVLLFVGFWVMTPIFGQIYGMFLSDDDYNTRYTTEGECDDGGGYWYDSECHQVSERASGVMAKIRNKWLAVPFIVVAGLVLWHWTKSTNKDVQQWGGGP